MKMEEKKGREEMGSNDRGEPVAGTSAQVRGADEQDTCEEDVIVKLEAKSDMLASIAIEMVSLIEQGPSDLQVKENMIKIVEVAKVLIGLAQKQTESRTETPRQLDEDEIADQLFWSDPRTLYALEEAERDELKRVQNKRRLEDIPTFSLGLTQAEKENEEGRMLENNIHKNNAEVNEGQVVVHTKPNKEGDTVTVDDRLRRRLKTAVVHKSPFISRTVDPNEAFSAVEKAIWSWILLDSVGDSEVVVFKCKGLSVPKSGFKCMKGSGHIQSVVLRTWATVLNSREEHKSDDSPCRIFTKPFPCVYSTDGSKMTT
ncbi:unnamed protein product, partial [Cuscuta epithymum]